MTAPERKDPSRSQRVSSCEIYYFSINIVFVINIYAVYAIARVLDNSSSNIDENLYRYIE